MVDRSSADIEDIAAIAAMVVGHLSGAPMFCGNKGDGGSWKAKSFPPVDFVDFLKT